MFHELASAFAGFVLIQGTIFVVGDALGLLGERFAQTKSIGNWIADLPETLLFYFFSHVPKHYYKPHPTAKH